MIEGHHRAGGRSVLRRHVVVVIVIVVRSRRGHVDGIFCRIDVIRPRSETHTVQVGRVGPRERLKLNQAVTRTPSGRHEKLVAGRLLNRDISPQTRELVGHPIRIAGGLDLLLVRLTQRFPILDLLFGRTAVFAGIGFQLGTVGPAMHHRPNGVVHASRREVNAFKVEFRGRRGLVALQLNHRRLGQ